MQIFLLSRDRDLISRDRDFTFDFLGDRVTVCPVCNVGVLWPNGWMDRDAPLTMGGTGPPSNTWLVVTCYPTPHAKRHNIDRASHHFRPHA